jgi:hypothetical protein
MEINYLVAKLESGEIPLQIIIDGKHSAIIKAGLRVRAKIIEWYRTNLDKEIAEIGDYIESGPDKRKWKRGDLLALEMIRKGKDVPEEGEERIKVMIDYLLEMASPGTWGSTPEYTAAAFLTKSKVIVWQKFEEGLKIINTINDGEHEVNLLFERNHYSALCTEEQKQVFDSNGVNTDHFLLFKHG